LPTFDGKRQSTKEKNPTKIHPCPMVHNIKNQFNLQITMGETNVVWEESDAVPW